MELPLSLTLHSTSASARLLALGMFTRMQYTEDIPDETTAFIDTGASVALSSTPAVMLPFVRQMENAVVMLRSIEHCEEQSVVMYRGTVNVTMAQLRNYLTDHELQPDVLRILPVPPKHLCYGWHEYPNHQPLLALDNETLWYSAATREVQICSPKSMQILPAVHHTTTAQPEYDLDVPSDMADFADACETWGEGDKPLVIGHCGRHALAQLVMLLRPHWYVPVLSTDPKCALIPRCAKINIPWHAAYHHDDWERFWTYVPSPYYCSIPAFLEELTPLVPEEQPYLDEVLPPLYNPKYIREAAVWMHFLAYRHAFELSQAHHVEGYEARVDQAQEGVGGAQDEREKHSSGSGCQASDSDSSRCQAEVAVAYAGAEAEATSL
jgi:hypothetical protein